MVGDDGINARIGTLAAQKHTIATPPTVSDSANLLNFRVGAQLLEDVLHQRQNMTFSVLDQPRRQSSAGLGSIGSLLGQRLFGVATKLQSDGSCKYEPRIT